MSVLDDRVRGIQGRLAMRAWEYRQRNHSKGVWLRVRRVLADAQHAFIIDEGDAAMLANLGYRPEPAGLELQPPRELWFVPRDVLDRLNSAQEVAVRLSADLLGAKHVALLRFP
jgi:hypothetical protein